MKKNNQPIGILDSGMGGLTIWKEVVVQLPNESIIYIADSKNCPYGSKSEERIYELARKMISFLLTKNVKLIVIACNTISVSSLDRLRIAYPYIPIIGIVPVVKKAAEVSKNKRIGILTTTATSKSAYQKHLINEFAKDCCVTTVGTDRLVPLIERGEVDGWVMEKILRAELDPFIKTGVDAVALGCSHYPFLKSVMQQILTDNVLLLDSSKAVARQVKRVLENNHSVASLDSAQHTFYTSGDTDIFLQTTKKLLGGRIQKAERIDL